MITQLPVAVLLCALLMAPHLLPRASLSPVAGIALWFSVLWLRAVLSVVVVLACVLYLPSTAPFKEISSWCLHAAMPFFASHLGMSGHSVGDAASFLPALLLAILAAAAGIGTWKAAHRVGGWLRGNVIGNGPSESLIIAGHEVIVATAGVCRPKVIVSTGALLDLDDEELAAGLEHEWGHVKRGHRVLTVLSVGLLGCSRLLPLGRRAFRQLHFHVERDADQYAVRRTGDALALASAICKAAVGGGAVAEPVALSSLAGADTTERLRLLVDGAGRARDARTSVIGFGLSAITLVAVSGLLLVLPGLALATITQAHVSFGQLSGCLS